MSDGFLRTAMALSLPPIVPDPEGIAVTSLEPDRRPTDAGTLPERGDEPW